MSKQHSESYLNLENTNTIPGFTIFNANIGYTLGHYSGIFSLNNFTNRRYYTNGNLLAYDLSPTTESHFYTNPLINAFLTIKYKL